VRHPDMPYPVYLAARLASGALHGKSRLPDGQFRHHSHAYPGIMPKTDMDVSRAPLYTFNCCNAIHALCPAHRVPGSCGKAGDGTEYAHYIGRRKYTGDTPNGNN